MKFDVVIGNPPYQENIENTSDNPLYDKFMDAAYKIGDFVILITPARFLSNAGKTSKKWNEKILNDTHFKVIRYEPDGQKIFMNIANPGSIAIHCRNAKKKYGEIKIFTSSKELNSILLKVQNKREMSITNSIYIQNKFNLSKLYKDFPDLKNKIGSQGKEKRLTSNCFEFECFKDNKENENDIEIIGVINRNKRISKFIDKKYLEIPHPNLEKYKVILPASNGNGSIDLGIIGRPLIGYSFVGYTQSFIGIGAFDTQNEAENAMKYIKSKFARCMLGILKANPNNKKDTWKYVPLQDFTNKSDINWDCSIQEIDKQLYKKYGLDEKEINFIETHVKEMKDE